jgi:PTH1 family peptidyl-tRNA hydrolase
MRNANFNLEQMIVIHDDLDLEIGTMKIKVDGGHGGHNGLKSIINLSGKSFVRLRVGIGHPGNKTDVTNWVLGKFKPAEIDSLIESYYKFNHIIELLGDNKIEQAQLQLHSG